MKANTRTVKDIILILLLGVISFYLILDKPKIPLTSLFQSDSREVSSPIENQGDRQKAQFEQSLAQTHAFYKQKIAAHEHKINTLNEQIKHFLQQHEEMIFQAPDSKNKITDNKPSSTIIEAEEQQAANQQQLASELEQYLANESYDSEWAEPIETQMADVITEELRLDGNELVEASCRTTLCRIEIGHEDELAESKFLLAIASRSDLLNNIEDIMTHRVSAEESGDGIVHSVFFIARKGHQLPVSTNSLNSNDLKDI